ncbi:MAG: hypothetical protein KJ668_08275 [Proteobacteria bacterium]|nr:hypothetical protein [Pseudomonadota bacterium]
MTDIIRRIGANAHQAAELEQSLKNRVLLQSKIAKDILNLKTVFEEFSQDDRKLFTALFQNQLPPGPAFSDSNQDSFINSFPLDGFVNSFPENFFGIDVTSKFGSLSAFNITSNAIEILSGRNSGKNLLEFLLDNLTKSIFNFPGIKNSEQDQNGFKTIQNLDIARLLAQSTYFSRTTADSNPLTIIDLVG